MSPVLPAAVSSADLLEPAHEEMASAFDDHCRRLYCKLPQVEWDVHLDSQRSAALAKWHKIVLADPMSFEVCRMHFQSLKTGLQGGKLQDDLKNVFSSKSTSTLHGRAGPMMRFLHFCGDKQLKAFPLTEEVVYAFMQHEEQSAAPTFLRSFLSSLGFALHVVGLIGAKRVLDSRRIKGLADKCYLQKKKTRSRLLLSVSELTTLEEIVLGHRGRGIPDRHAAGCFLFMVYARTRFSDMLNVGRLDFEAGEDGKGYIEARFFQIENFLFHRQESPFASYDSSDAWCHCRTLGKCLEGGAWEDWHHRHTWKAIASWEDSRRLAHLTTDSRGGDELASEYVAVRGALPRGESQVHRDAFVQIHNFVVDGEVGLVT